MVGFNNKDMINIFACLFVSIILRVVTSYLEIWVLKDPIQIIILEQMMMFVPTLLFAKKLVGILVFSTISGVVFGLIENIMKPVPMPQYIILHLATSLINGLSSYPYKRSKNLVFASLILVGIAASSIIHYFVNYYYGDLWLGLASLLYMFR